MNLRQSTLGLATNRALFVGKQRSISSKSHRLRSRRQHVRSRRCTCCWRWWSLKMTNTRSWVNMPTTRYMFLLTRLQRSKCPASTEMLLWPSCLSIEVSIQTCKFSFLKLSKYLRLIVVTTSTRHPLKSWLRAIGTKSWNHSLFTFHSTRSKALISNLESFSQIVPQKAK